jgi:superfamily I DNA and/or RNA helicase
MKRPRDRLGAGIEVATVDAFQGGEEDAMAFSAVVAS